MKALFNALRRRVKGQVIYAWLLIVGLFGASIILFARDLANAPGMVRADHAIMIGVQRLVPNYEEPEHGLLTDHFFTEIGIAFVVAAILGATFEIFMRRREEREHYRHIADIEKTALTSILGFFVPQSISDEVIRVFEQRIMRSNLQVTYTFNPLPPEVDVLDEVQGAERDRLGRQDLLMVTVTVEYDLVNLTRITARHTIDHGFEPTLPFGGTQNKFLRLTIQRDRKELLSWPEGRNAGLVCVKPGPKPYLRALTVENWGSLGPGQKNAVHVVVEHQLVRRRCDQDSWTTWLPADSLALTTRVTGDAGLELDFHVERTHPDEFKEEANGTGHHWTLPVNDKVRDGKTVRESVGVLPYQGFTLYWFPRAR